MTDAAHQPWLSARGFAPLTAQLQDAHARFVTALDAREQGGGPNFEAVKDARAAGQDRYLEVVAHVITATTDAPELRAKLLAPVFHQERQVQSARRQRQTPVEVDPISGEPLE